MKFIITQTVHSANKPYVCQAFGPYSENGAESKLFDIARRERKNPRFDVSMVTRRNLLVTQAIEVSYEYQIIRLSS